MLALGALSHHIRNVTALRLPCEKPKIHGESLEDEIPGRQVGERGRKRKTTRRVSKKPFWKWTLLSLADATQLRDKLPSPTFPEFLTHKMARYNKPLSLE